MKLKYTILAACLAGMTSANAVVTVTDLGTTTPTIGANDTGLTTQPASRFSFDVSPDDKFTQTFTVPAAGTIQSIFLAYNDFDDGNDMTLDLTVNGTTFAGIFLDGNNFTGAPTDNANNGIYWMEFDLSGEGIAAVTGAAANSFFMDATASTEVTNGFAFAPLVTFNQGDLYDGGAFIAGGDLSQFPNQDLGFVVTVNPVPEPSSLALLGLSFGGLLLRRRR